MQLVDRIDCWAPKQGVRPRGTVFYSDQLQILVKWDNGSSHAEAAVDRYRIIE